MIDTTKHIIKQQVLDLTISNLKDQEDTSHVVSEIYKRNIEGILEEICNEMIPADRVVKIDSLVIDIGRLRYDRLALDFPKAVRKSIKEALYKEVRDEIVRSNGSVKRIKDHENKENALLEYLRTGLIPWYYDGNFIKLKSEFSNKKINTSYELVQVFSNAISITRAIHFFEEEKLHSFLMEKLSYEKKNVLTEFVLLKKILSTLNSIANVPIKNRSISANIKPLLEICKPKNKVYDKMIRQLVDSVYSNDSSSVIFLEKTTYLIEVLPKKYYQKIQALFKNIEWEKLNKFNKDELLFVENLRKEKNAQKIVNIKSNISTSEEKIKSKEISLKQSLEIGESIVIKNAGLVLVWPYLQSFFTGLDLMQEKTFLDDQKTAKAIHLLHYLVFQTEESNETEWVLNKLLCGVEIIDFVPEKMELSGIEKEECDNLLKALINNWSALKKTSPDSLRKTFLMREGLLMKNDNGWMLKIERKAFDILLDRLTWAISVIKLPWNNYMIHTEW
ncbi:contractile injection system tape measure protein [uncultured Aquimarina sp.]|uniref:contractile injection system tape measure protein n=1 Tax=uncultured Aquimarina sp. TaxID=575652 RepID=UPI00262B54AF|nr:contractile injection system tape measure protein [uncultured Aquimarina sp.]